MKLGKVIKYEAKKLYVNHLFRDVKLTSNVKLTPNIIGGLTVYLQTLAKNASMAGQNPKSIDIFNVFIQHKNLAYHTMSHSFHKCLNLAPVYTN